MMIIGLTGGIGSGKTEASKYLSQRGIKIIDADKISREIVFPGSDALIEIANHFGAGILNKDGSLNRKALADIVFSSDSQLKILNNIMHQKIKNEVHNKLDYYKSLKENIAVIDAPLLFETGLNTMTDEVWVIDVTEDLQVKRIKERDHLSDDEIKKRIESQMKREVRNKYADVIINNSGERANLYLQIDKHLKRIKDKIID